MPDFNLAPTPFRSITTSFELARGASSGSPLGMRARTRRGLVTFAGRPRPLPLPRPVPLPLPLPLRVGGLGGGGDTVRVDGRRRRPRVLMVGALSVSPSVLGLPDTAGFTVPFARAAFRDAHAAFFAAASFKICSASRGQ